MSERIDRQVERLLNEVEEAVEESDWDTVRVRSEAILALDPENEDARAYLSAAERVSPGTAALPRWEELSAPPALPVVTERRLNPSEQAAIATAAKAVSRAVGGQPRYCWSARLSMAALLFSAAIITGEVFHLTDRLSLAEEIRDDFESDLFVWARRSDDSAWGFEITQAVSLVVTAVFFIRWLYVANRRLEDLGDPDRRGNGWAVGGWFVPILNFWRPAQMAQQAWRGSDPLRAAGRWSYLGNGTALVYVWWVPWIVGGIVASATPAGTGPDNSAVEAGDGLVSAIQAQIAGDVLLLVSAVAGIVLIAALERRFWRASHAWETGAIPSAGRSYLAFPDVALLSVTVLAAAVTVTALDYRWELPTFSDGGDPSAARNASVGSTRTKTAAPTPTFTPTATATPTPQVEFRGAAPVAGDCVRLESEGEGVRTVVVGCSIEHDARVLARVALREGAVPSAPEIQTEAERSCPSGTLSLVYPSSQSWAAGDRWLLCLDSSLPD